MSKTRGAFCISPVSRVAVVCGIKRTRRVNPFTRASNSTRCVDRFPVALSQRIDRKPGHLSRRLREHAPIKLDCRSTSCSSAAVSVGAIAADPASVAAVRTGPRGCCTGHAPRDHALAGRAARSLNAAGSHRRGQVDPALRLSRQPEHSRPGRSSSRRSWCRLPASSAPTSSAIASPAGRAHFQQDGLEDGSQELVGVLLLRIRNSHKRMAEREGFEPSSGETPEPDFESGAFDHSATFPDSGALGPAHWLRLTSLARPDPSPQSYASLRIVDH